MSFAAGLLGPLQNHAAAYLQKPFSIESLARAVRAALDTYGVPYTYFADQRLRERGNVRRLFGELHLQ